MNRRSAAVLLTLLALLVPATAGAQVGIYLGGGATVPTSDFGDIAKTGWVAHGGVVIPVGEMGLNVIAGGLYGSNDHDVGIDSKSTLLGGSAGLLYRVGEQTRPGVYFFGTVGALRHEIEVANVSDSQTGLSYTGGAGVAIPVSSVSLWLSGTYTGTSGDADATFFGIQAGVTIWLGSSN